MKINLLINERSNKPICSVQSKNGTNYIVYKNILDEIKKICLNYNQIYVTENNINITKDSLSLNIKNYKKNTNKDIESIIKKLTKDFRELKKKQLRKQKIRRFNAITGTIIISGAMLVNALSIDKSDKKIENEENIEISNEITTLAEETKVKSGIENIIYETQKELEKSDEDLIQEQNIFELNYDSRIETEKYQITKSYYKDIISKISTEYGIDPQIMLAIATQECGIHDPNLRGPAIGLMQIERSVWIGEKVSAYNYEKGVEETLNITEEKLKDLDFNIRVACMIFRDCYKNSNYNLPVAIQMYNFGYGNMKKTFKMAYDKGFKEMCDNCDETWLQYRDNIKAGDNEYLEHVVSYIEDINDIKCKKENEIIKYTFKNKNQIYSM